jgi:hypothetical protein
LLRPVRCELAAARGCSLGHSRLGHSRFGTSDRPCASGQVPRSTGRRAFDSWACAFYERVHSCTLGLASFSENRSVNLKLVPGEGRFPTSYLPVGGQRCPNIARPCLQCEGASLALHVIMRVSGVLPGDYLSTVTGGHGHDYQRDSTVTGGHGHDYHRDSTVTGDPGQRVKIPAIASAAARHCRRVAADAPGNISPVTLYLPLLWAALSLVPVMIADSLCCQ